MLWGGGQFFVVVVMRVWGSLQNFNVCVKVFYLLVLVLMKRLLQREYFFWPFFLTSQYFCVYEISQFCKFLGFLQIVREIQNQNVVPDFSVYFDLKFLSFAKINLREISKPLHSWKLVQAKILRRECSEKVKKLVCNTISYSCWMNHLVRNGAQSVTLSYDVL